MSMRTVNCPHCTLLLSYPPGCSVIQCPACQNLSQLMLVPQYVISCVGCQMSLSVMQHFSVVQCPRCRVQMRTNQSPVSPPINPPLNGRNVMQEYPGAVNRPRDVALSSSRPPLHQPANSSQHNYPGQAHRIEIGPTIAVLPPTATQRAPSPNNQTVTSPATPPPATYQPPKSSVPEEEHKALDPSSQTTNDQSVNQTSKTGRLSSLFKKKKASTLSAAVEQSADQPDKPSEIENKSKSPSEQSSKQSNKSSASQSANQSGLIDAFSVVPGDYSSASNNLSGSSKRSFVDNLSDSFTRFSINGSNNQVSEPSIDQSSGRFLPLSDDSDVNYTRMVEAQGGQASNQSSKQSSKRQPVVLSSESSSQSSNQRSNQSRYVASDDYEPSISRAHTYVTYDD